MIRSIGLIGLVLCFPFLALAQQDSILLTKNFDFKDGIFLTYQSFQKNNPDYQWNELKSNLVANPQTFMAQIEYLELKESSEKIDLAKIWGISLGGIPYIRLEKGAVKKTLTTFAALRLRGKICYFEYEDFDEVQVPMPVYNPVTGRPYREALVNRRIDVIYEWMMDFETGEVQPLTTANLKEWVKDDPQLITALESLGDDAREKLFKCILIYDDRHEVYIYPDVKE